MVPEEYSGSKGEKEKELECQHNAVNRKMPGEYSE